MEIDGPPLANANNVENERHWPQSCVWSPVVSRCSAA
jgi:hypothetical protein